MTQKVLKLEVIDCPVTGEIGLAAVGFPVHDDYVAVTSGFVLAHDLIEHPNGIDKIGGVGDELEATGSIWYTRGRHHDLQRPDRSIYSPEQSLAFEISTNFRYWFDRGCEFDMPVPRSTSDVFDADIIAILKIGVENIRSGFEDYCDDDYSPTTSDIAIFISACKHFMRSGIVKQQARFPNNEWEANGEFWSVQEAVEPFATSLDHVGQTFDLRWGDGEAIMVETFEWDEDEENEEEEFED